MARPKKAEIMVQTSVMLPTALRDYVEQEAADMHISFAAYVRMLVAQDARKRAYPHEPPSTKPRKPDNVDKLVRELRRDAEAHGKSPS